MQLGLSLALTQTRNIGVASAPSRFSSSWWTLTDAAIGGTLTVTINSLPYNGGSALTDIEYQVDGAGWVSSGLTGIGNFNITGLTAASHFVALRAVNALGKAAADYSFGGSTPQFVIDDAAQYYLSQTGKTAASARTVTMTDPVTVRDSDGLWKHSCHNMVSYPSDISNSYWYKANGAIGSDADGYKLIEDTSNSQHFVTGNTNAVFGRQAIEAEVKFKGRWASLQAPGSNNQVWFDIENGAKGTEIGTATGTITALADGWYRIKLEDDVTTTNYAGYVFARSGDGSAAYLGDGSSGIAIRKIWTYDSSLGGMQNNPDTGTSFVGGTGTGPFFARPVEYATDGSASMPIAPGRTNRCTYSDDLTNAAWVKTNVTTAKTATGIGGETNGATKLTATAANATCIFSDTVASAAKIANAFVKRITGTGTIEMTLDGGTTWEAVTITSSFAQVGTATQTIANPTVGFRIVTSGDEIAVQAAQIEDGTFHSPPIITNGAVTSRAAIQASSAKAMIGSDSALTKGTWVEVFKSVADLAGGVIAAGATAGQDIVRIGTSSAQAINDNGTTDLTLSSISPVLSDGENHRSAVAFLDGTGRSLSVDGAVAVTDANNYLNTNPPTNFWWGGDVNQANMPGGSMILGVMFPDRLSDADLASITDPATIYPSWGEKSATPT